ncbi:D-alanine--D-alanine ligase family protein [Anaerotalea alkaliphila]|uniref:D-alanine--D-alanine ligase n=1 Tax=Anaerotalea alkaliphila TaxID=2662126 RepID=A0A7X5HUM0_9FIRM|nr:D-alanine--D-alanine ligase [Anaerotalea alkaliphila]NDL66930.1 D-alanine--D-alanine ligase [Anaerotalea alkaliphila]
MLRVGVIMGGDSLEREVSILTGNEFLRHMNRDKYLPVPIFIRRPKEILAYADEIDVALIALHGKNGEDGKVQALLEALEIPYSGSGIASSALCMDKTMSKMAMGGMGILTPPFAAVSKQDWEEGSWRSSTGSLVYPLIVKPNQGGSSMGITVVEDPGALEEGIRTAFGFDDRVLVEEFIQGTEITCSLLKGEVIPILKVSPTLRFFDYDSKYKETTGALTETVRDVPGEVMEEVQRIAQKIWKLFSLKNYARIDMMIRNKQVYVIEINTLPGMTPYSLLPKSASEGGYGFGEMLDKIIQDVWTGRATV